jgi:hypothetical protein
VPRAAARLPRFYFRPFVLFSLAIAARSKQWWAMWCQDVDVSQSQIQISQSREESKVVVVVVVAP